jgi:hypothetical protein
MAILLYCSIQGDWSSSSAVHCVQQVAQQPSNAAVTTQLQVGTVVVADASHASAPINRKLLSAANSSSVQDASVSNGSTMVSSSTRKGAGCFCLACSIVASKMHEQCPAHHTVRVCAWNSSPAKYVALCNCPFELNRCQHRSCSALGFGGSCSSVCAAIGQIGDIACHVDIHILVCAGSHLTLAVHCMMLMQACPDGKPPVMCKMSPCKPNTCGPNETCVVNRCGGCKWTCKKGPAQSHPAQRCADGSQRATCDTNPCAATLCAPGTTCRVDRCDSCKAVCTKPVNHTTLSSFMETINAGRGTVAHPVARCKDGSRPVECLVDPCRAKKCGEGELCESNYCGGCNAVCKPAPPSPWVPAPTTCSDGFKPVNCFIDPCEAKKCADGELCVRDYCGGCNAACQPAPAPVKAQPKTCADGSSPVQCLMDPCISAICTAGEVCEADYCGDCKAVCRKPAPEFPPGVYVGKPNTCADGSSPVQCLMDPCKHVKCADDEVCVSNYCGGCNAVCQPPPASPWVPAPTTCSDGSEPVNCFVDPCEAKKCADGELCVRDYCGGCNAACQPAPIPLQGKPRDSVSTSSNPVAGSCADGSRPVACLVDPCSTARCGYGLVCESNYCGGCNVVCKEP